MAHDADEVARWPIGPPAPRLLTILTRILEVSVFVMTAIWVSGVLCDFVNARDVSEPLALFSLRLMSPTGRFRYGSFLTFRLSLLLQIFNNLGGLRLSPKVVRLSGPQRSPMRTNSS